VVTGANLKYSLLLFVYLIDSYYLFKKETTCTTTSHAPQKANRTEAVTGTCFTGVENGQP